MSVLSHRELRILTLRSGLDQGRLAIARVADLDAQVAARLRERHERLTDDADLGLDESEEGLRDAEDLIAETLEFLAGAAARSVDYDGGMSKLALAWLDRLSDTSQLPRVGLVIPASTEFTGMLSQVVRLKVPSEGVWALPVAVHEFGHFVAAELGDRVSRDGLPDAVTPVEKLLHDAATKADLPQLYWHGHELFADGLAAATVGPAYPWYCVRYRFAPELAQRETGSHPAPVRRIRMQLAVLNRLAEDDETGYLKADAAKIGAAWIAGLAAAGVSTEVPADPSRDQLEKDLMAILFDDSHLRRIHYGGHPAAIVLARNPESIRTSVTQVLNAAWSRRSDLEATPNLSPVNAIARLDQIAGWALAATAEVLR